jgi:plasmid stabilization system protein ParE
MKIVRLPQALVDLVEIAEYLAERDATVADRFLDSFETTIETLRRSPKIGTLRASDRYGDIRMWFIDGFERCLIFYTEGASEIVILRLLHASRDYTRFI